MFRVFRDRVEPCLGQLVGPELDLAAGCIEAQRQAFLHRVVALQPCCGQATRLFGVERQGHARLHAELVRPGVTTGSIDDAVRGMMLDAGAIPATLGYRGYAHSSCISINHVICHGIPGDKVLKDGDILNIDVTPLVDGWHGDTSRMFYAGEPSLKAKKLVEVTYECLMLGIAAAQPGARLGDIGAAIEAHANQFRYGVVREFCGHGLGRLFHDAPEVVHAARAGTGPGMVGHAQVCAGRGVHCTNRLCLALGVDWFDFSRYVI